MAAPEGNNFWEQRSKHGRDKIFQSPETMWEAACEYFQWCVDNPFIEEENLIVSLGSKVGSQIEKATKNVMRPFTMEGLCMFLGCNTKYFYQFNDTTPNKDFSHIITRIQETIYNQKYSGAVSGFFNANIIARDLGLTDKSEIKQTTITVKVEGEDE